MEQIVQELLNSERFLAWNLAPQTTQGPRSYSGLNFEYKGPTYTNLVVDEKHFSPAQLAEAWGVSAETIRILFRNESGVLHIPSAAKHHPKTKVRNYESLKIPQSVAERVHRRLSAVPQ